jgi:hypothetical protein
LGEERFCGYKLSETVLTESRCRFERTRESAISTGGLTFIVTPSSVVVLSIQSFCWCGSLESVVFENGSRLDQIEELAFCGGALTSIELPPRISFIDEDEFDTPVRFHSRNSRCCSIQRGRTNVSLGAPIFQSGTRCGSRSTTQSPFPWTNRNVALESRWHLGRFPLRSSRWHVGRRDVPGPWIRIRLLLEALIGL